MYDNELFKKGGVNKCLKHIGWWTILRKFNRKRKKKVINILASFSISYKNAIKYFLK